MRTGTIAAAASLAMTLAACGVDEEVAQETSSELVTSRSDAVSTSFSFEGIEGAWGQTLFCEPGTFARGFKIKVEGRQHGGDDTAMNAVRLGCYDRDDGDFVEQLIAEEGPWGSWSPAWVACPGDDNFIKGARMKIEEPQGAGDDTYANDIQFACRHGGTIAQENGGPWGDWSEWKFCPANTFVCGAQVKMDPSQGSGDDDAMGGMRLRCCKL